MILLDTHVLVWAVEDDPRLGRNARALIEQASVKSRILVSAITPWEIAMLAEKGRLALGIETGRWLAEALALPGMILAPVLPEIAVDSVRLAAFHADPADRMIVATARHHRVSLLSADRAILDYAQAGHLQALDASR